MGSDGLIIPALCLALIAWVVPKLLSMVLDEGVKPLLLNAFASTFILFAVSAMFFVGLYILQGLSWAELAQFSFLENAVFFGKLGLIAGLIWGPIMVLSLANLPRHWVKETW